jgi:hypothetical protein
VPGTRLVFTVDNTGLVIDLAALLQTVTTKVAAKRGFRVDAPGAKVYFEQGASVAVTDVLLPGQFVDLTHGAVSGDDGVFIAGNLVEGQTSGATGIIEQVIDATTIRVQETSVAAFAPVETIEEQDPTTTPTGDTASMTAAAVSAVQRTSEVLRPGVIDDIGKEATKIALQTEVAVSTTVALVLVERKKIPLAD